MTIELNIDQLKQQNDQMKLQLRGVAAQLEGCREIVNELTQAVLTGKTNLILYKEAHQEVSQNLAAVQKAKDECDKTIEMQRAQLGALTQKIIELTQPKVEGNVTTDDLVKEAMIDPAN